MKRIFRLPALGSAIVMAAGGAVIVLGTSERAYGQYLSYYRYGPEPVAGPYGGYVQPQLRFNSIFRTPLLQAQSGAFGNRRYEYVPYGYGSTFNSGIESPRS